MSLSGLAQLNLETTSVCDKTHLCTFCGHQDQSINPIKYGHMDYELLKDIRSQVEPGIVISFHRDGDPLAYPLLRDALDLFQGFTTSLVTHGLNLGRRADEIIGRCTTVTVSVFRGDPDGKAQYAALTKFLVAKGDKSPQVNVKIVGDMHADEVSAYSELGVRILRRLIHVPIDNSKYAHRNPAIPEVGVCLDFLHRPTIDWRGGVFMCNRLDPHGSGLLGNLYSDTLDEIWNGDKRREWLAAHQLGRRDLASPLCKGCLHWGTPSA